MAEAIFDTHAYVKKLIKTGVSEEQAEVQAEALKEVIESKLATREYLDLKLADVDLKLPDVKAEIKILK